MKFHSRLGEGVPVDLAGLVGLAAGAGVGWCADTELHDGLDLSDGPVGLEALLAREMRGVSVSSPGVSLFLQEPGERRFQLTSRLPGATTLRVQLPRTGDVDVRVFDEFASMASETSLVMTEQRGFSSRIAHVSKQIRRAGQSPRGFVGVGEVHWFGEPFVSMLGGDEVFGALPTGWAERTAFGQWRVIGLDFDEDPAGFSAGSWSTREKALIEALGSDLFFNLETGALPAPMDEFVIPPAAYRVFVLVDGAVMVQEVDGSLVEPELSESANAGLGRVGAAMMRDRVDLLGQELAGIGLADVLEGEPSLMEEWVRGQSVFGQASLVKLVGAWLGEHVVGIDQSDELEWVEDAGRWMLHAHGLVFDPFAVVEAVTRGDADSDGFSFFVTSTVLEMAADLES